VTNNPEPFPGDYGEGATAAAAEGRATHGRVRQQVGALDEQANRSTPAAQTTLTQALDSRYQRRRNRRLARVAGKRGVDLVCVDGELLVSAETWADRGARAFLEYRGMREESLGCAELEGRVVRLVATDEASIEELDATTVELRSRGFAASLTHVTTSGPIVKPQGLSGPAPAEKLRPFAEYPRYGNGDGAAHVAIVDTGIVGPERADGWLGSVERRRSGSGGHGDPANVDPLDIEPHDGLLDIAAGHGTFVAGVVAQVAPRARISVYRALHSGGAGSEVDVACAMVDAARAGANVINLSLASPSRDDQPSVAISAALDVIAEIGRERGEEIVVVAAAGNFGGTVPTWPAAFRQVLAVGALTEDGLPTSWSSRGFWVDCSVVGEGILSTYVEGEESYEFTADPDTFGPDAFARWSGTSFAAPQVAGGIARLMEEQGIGARRAADELLARGRYVPDFGKAMRILPGL
jgi:subtilisin family serine protease